MRVGRAIQIRAGERPANPRCTARGEYTASEKSTAAEKPIGSADGAFDRKYRNYGVSGRYPRR